MNYEPAPGEFRNNIPWFEPLNRHRVLNMLKGWQPLTEKYSCTLAQLVIAWTVAPTGITVALCGARKPEHARQNAAAGSLVLEPEDILKMRSDAEALGEPL